MKIHRLLIANRGEIAARVIRSCEQLGIESVLAASDADLDSVPARRATHTVRLGPAPAAQSYLDIDRVVAAARAARVDAVHPGYGFLSENVAFGRACEQAGLIFIGPTPAQLLAVGDKLCARELAITAGLPVVPGGPVSNYAEAHRLAQHTGYPLLIKAVGGGGGRGMQRVDEPGRLGAALDLAMAEALAAFGDGRVYLERFIGRGRHIEVQVLGDGRDAIHLGERDCSVQRRYQKLIEEAAAPNLDDAVRSGLHDAALRLARHLRYRGAGTVEFLVDADTGSYYFLEMNARIQVEHPVTEAITGVDLVAEQIAVAEGLPLRLAQADIAARGVAIECRINAEDASAQFRPSPGTVISAAWPAGGNLRVDTHIEAGSSVPPYYDSLLAKVIAWGATRSEAIESLRGGLAHTWIDGVESNLALQRSLLADPEFIAGGVDTGYLARYLARH